MIREQCQNPLISADNDNNGNHLNGLTTRQYRALMALLESPSIVAAARKAEVGESTLREWLRKDEDFQALLRLLRQRCGREAEQPKHRTETAEGGFYE